MCGRAVAEVGTESRNPRLDHFPLHIRVVGSVLVAPQFLKNLGHFSNSNMHANYFKYTDSNSVVFRG